MFLITKVPKFAIFGFYIPIDKYTHSNFLMSCNLFNLDQYIYIYICVCVCDYPPVPAKNTNPKNFFCKNLQRIIEDLYLFIFICLDYIYLVSVYYSMILRVKSDG